MESLKFMIDSTDAETMAKKLGLNSVLNLLPHITKSAQKLARVPISGFPVAAVGLSSDGRIFIGVNVEFPGLPLHQVIHAEQFLITHVSQHPQTRLENVVVSAYPCGHCRQFLQEVRGAPDIQIFVPTTHEEDEDEDDRGHKFSPLSHFLPNRFGPDDLLHKDVPLMLEDRDNQLAIGEIESSDTTTPRNGVVCNGGSEERSLISAAFEAANKSHAPYSGCPSGVALKDEFGNVFKGSYMESAAYNPSMGPAQAAIVAYMAASASASCGAGFEGVVSAVLVECEGALIRQEESVRLFFNVVAPKCEFSVFHCHKKSKNVN